jgi:hypothetical protein
MVVVSTPVIGLSARSFVARRQRRVVLVSNEESPARSIQ